MTPTPLSIVMQVMFIIVCMAILYVAHKYFNVFTKSLNKDDIIKQYLTLQKESTYNKEISGILVRLKLELQSAKVGLMRFHNGGKFANGIDMKKFTATHETASDTIEPFMDKCVSVLNSRYPVAFEILGISGQFVVSDVDDCVDLNFKADMKKYGFKSCYLFLINQAEGHHEGFIGINFTQTTVLDAQKRAIVNEQIPRILALINMVE